MKWLVRFTPVIAVTAIMFMILAPVRGVAADSQPNAQTDNSGVVDLFDAMNDGAKCAGQGLDLDLSRIVAHARVPFVAESTC